MRPAIAVAFLLLTALIAGCADGGAEGTSSEPEPEAFDDVQVTSTTGAIRGVVVNEAIVPLEGALVQIANGANKTTDKDGAFVFNGLEPGDYFLSASLDTYNTIQQAVTVTAGDEEPPITKIMLLADPVSRPYAQLLQWDGYLTCGLMWSSSTLREAPYPLYIGGYLGFNACGLYDDRFISDFAVGSTIPAFVQAEAVWEGTQPLSNDLSLGYYRGGTTDWKGIYGESPLVLTANNTELNEEYDERGDDVDDGVAHNLTNLPMRVFPGMQDEPASMVVTTNQAFTVYQTQFYGFVPREGWLFVVEGPCSTPEQCGASE
jgi:hypothetical protein